MKKYYTFTDYRLFIDEFLESLDKVIPEPTKKERKNGKDNTKTSTNASSKAP